MFLLVGTDEAGYGPNLGPLVVSASVWAIDRDPADAKLDDRLYRVLRKVVCPAAADAHRRRVAWADSKALYSPDLGLAVLERGVLAALHLLGNCPADWRSLWRLLDPPAADGLDALPWHIRFNAALPLADEAPDVDKLLPALALGLAAAGVRLIGLRSRAIFPEQFNGLAEQHGNKAEVLSRVTLELIAEALAGPIAASSPLPVRVICDRHGGRSRYAPFLQRQFGDYLVEIHREDPTESRYAWGPPESRIDVRFRVQGEDFLPVALASMVSKYLREAAMLAFNRFWCAHLPELRPTAGYPGDALRFKRQIEPLQRTLGVEDHVLWRTR
jgi:hypothetical protein